MLDLILSLLFPTPAAIIVRMGTLGILFVAPYRAFGLMLAVGIMREATLWPLSYDPAAYAPAFEASLVVWLVFQVWAAMSTYDSLARRRTRDFAAALSAALALAVLPLIFETPHIDGSKYELLRIVLLVYRWVSGGLAVLLIGPAITSTRKVQPHTWLLVCYFGQYAIVCLVKNLLPLQVPMLDRFHLGVVAALYAGWLALLPAWSAVQNRSQA